MFEKARVIPIGAVVRCIVRVPVIKWIIVVKNNIISDTW